MTNTDNNSSLKIEKSTSEITTIDQLAQSLAIHTRFISDNIIIRIIYLALYLALYLLYTLRPSLSALRPMPPALCSLLPALHLRVSSRAFAVKKKQKNLLA